MTKHSFQGEKLPDNIFFIGACHPFRYGKERKIDYLLKNKKLKEQKLIYNVYPFPISLLNFVVNFGSLSPEDEKCYIKNMVSKKIENFFWTEIFEKYKDNEDFKNNYERKCIYKYISKEDFDFCEELKRLSINSIIEAQNFIRDKNDISSVSLRDIKRFCIFCDFYVEYYNKNKKLFKNINQEEFPDEFEFRDYYLNLNKNDIYKNSIKLSLYTCYYLRIPTMELRQEFSKKMNSIFGDKFLEIAEHEQQYIAKNLETKKGIVKNRIFLENIFALFSCINAKIPLFIVGEPGTGKDIAYQILFRAMKGDSSDNSLFKSLSKLFVNSYQGSSYSTTKGVLNCFKKARGIKYNYYNYKEQIISMLLFNDIGIAELSPNNPLKVLKYELECDLNRISFVGLSNWALDSDIMNRGILLSIPPLQKNELEMTAINIAESYNEKLAQDNKDFFVALANTYFEYKKILQEKYPDKKDFHVLKDYYHLIKTAMKLILEKKEEDLDFIIDENFKRDIGLISIERNFGGLELFSDNNQTITSLEIIKNNFRKYFCNCNITKNYNVLQRIFENIKDNYSRYLLLIIREPILKYLILSIFNTGVNNKNLNKNLSFYIGSCIDEDINSERYYNKILNNIQFEKEENKILILSDLNKIYPCLIELFKQNFVEIGGKMFSRILIGSITSSLVDDGFKCIVVFEEKYLDKELPCFINAFEKHLITFDYLLRYGEYLEELEKIYNMTKAIFSKDIYKQLNIDKKLNLSAINWTKEKIKEIIYIKKLEYDKLGKRLLTQDFFDLFLENYSNTLSQDMIFFLKNSDMGKKYPGIPEKIIHFYEIGEHSNIYNFLKKIQNTKNVIYTFTDIDEPLFQNNIIDLETELLGKINRNSIEEIQISSINNENALKKYLDKIFIENQNNIKIIIIKFNDENKKIINYIMYFLEKYINEIKNDIKGKNKKAFILSVHMKRTINIELKEPISNAFNFNQIFIDDLNGEDISIIDIINLKEEEKNIFKDWDGNGAKNEINIFLKNNYKEIIDKEISIIDFLINNIERLNVGCILLLLLKSNSLKTFKFLLSKLDNFIITENELFSQEKNPRSFLLLKGIIENKLLNKFNFEEIKKIKYIECLLKNKENILKKIKIGEIKYNLFKNIDLHYEKIEVFKNKLNILLFDNKEEVEECMTSLYNKSVCITENLLILQKLLLKFKKVDKYKDDMEKIRKLIYSIKSGMLNELNKQEIKNEINKIDKNFNKIDSEKMNKYKESKFFMKIYEIKKMDNIIPKKEIEYFEQAENDFNKLKILFEKEKWCDEIPYQLLIDCFKCIKNKKRDNLRNELMTLIKIFEIKEFDDLKIHSLLFGLLSFCQKEEILLVAKNLNNLIIEFEAVDTELFNEFTQIRNNLLIKFDYDKIIHLRKILEYYGFDILDPDENDRDYIDILLNNFAEGSFKFIANINDNDFKKFEELINKSEDKSITNNDIQEMFKCSNFIHGLGLIKGIKNDKDLIKEFINEVQRTKNIKESFKNYAKCSEKILKLYNKK